MMAGVVPPHSLPHTSTSPIHNAPPLSGPPIPTPENGRICVAGVAWRAACLAAPGNSNGSLMGKCLVAAEGRCRKGLHSAKWQSEPHAETHSSGCPNSALSWDWSSVTLSLTEQHRAVKQKEITQATLYR